MKPLNKFAICCLVVIFCFVSFLSDAANAQRRDNLTYEEVELIRDVQELDKRMEIYIKTIDRRFLVLDGDTSQAKQIEKDQYKWGELPAGTRSELFLDIKNILLEAIDKIDDVAENDGKSVLIPPAVHTLADAARRFIPKFQSYAEKTTDKKDLGSLSKSIEFCNQIIEASEKVPRVDRKGKPLKKG